MNRENSHKLFVRALDIIPGGVNSPVRACKNVGSEPTFIDYAQGCMIFDEDGNGFIDYIGSWGPMILGHRHPSVVEAITSSSEKRHQLWCTHGSRNYTCGNGC